MGLFTFVPNVRNSNDRKVLSNFGAAFTLSDLRKKFHLDELLYSLGIKDMEL